MSSIRFFYHASAAGLSGRIHRPFEEILEVQAPTALPPKGGLSNAAVKNVRIRDYFSCASVTSRTLGEYHPATDTYETRSSSTAEQFNLNGVVTADLLRAQVFSSNRLGQKEQPAIVPTGTAIVNLKINGTPIDLESLVYLYEDMNTLEKIRVRHREDEEFRNTIHDLLMVGRAKDLEENQMHRYFPFCHRAPQRELHETRHAAILPLFRIRTPSGPGLRVIQNAIHIENFGRLHLGQLIVTPYQRQVTALQVDLGSPTEGDVTVCSVTGNGGTTDPPIEG